MNEFLFSFTEWMYSTGTTVIEFQVYTQVHT